MIARTTEIGVERYGGALEFDDGFIAGNLKPSALGKLYHSERGWPLSSIWPYRRPVLAPSAVDIGVIRNNENPREKHVGEMIHWSVIERLGRQHLSTAAKTPIVRQIRQTHCLRTA